MPPIQTYLTCYTDILTYHFACIWYSVILEMVISILNTPQVFKLSNASHVIYDVTDLLPHTSNLKRSSSKSAVAPDPMAQKYAPDESAGIQRQHESVADILVRNEEHNQVAAILSVSPYKNIVESYWGSYQKLFAIAFIIHVVIMSIYCYCGVTFMACPTTITNVTTGEVTTLNQKPWEAEVGLAVVLLWPILLILYDGFKFTLLIISCGKVGFIPTVMSYRGEGDQVLGLLALQGSGTLYSVLAVVWYIMNRVCADYQDYVLALSFIFGWIYAINFTRGFKQVHHFSIILRHIVFKDMIKFSLIYLFILLAFSFAYSAAIQAIPSLKMDSGEVIFLVFGWMIGNAEFQTDPEEFEAADRSEAFVRIIYVFYIIFSTIVLLNLLVGMMTDSYNTVREKSEIMWTVGSLRLPLEFESGVGRSRYNPPNLKFDESTDRWYLYIKPDHVTKHDMSTTDTINDLRGKIDELNNNFDHLLKSFEQLKNKL